ncbi:S1 family peptidase [Actinokineospora sp. UTMC 2448]|uniref:S1 family peptidase n=1 Tax=Actinokineospora sp. UTMC 2448 TaxID=2268449 RepID=UPI002163FFBC|nr:S1 family peptidase [Actinokineospora sp. UTMC 2448]UVS80881.1 Streptogrisin-A precursor [Actinokineospora sp. UTMC 2448]
MIAAAAAVLALLAPAAPVAVADGADAAPAVPVGAATAPGNAATVPGSAAAGPVGEGAGPVGEGAVGPSAPIVGGDPFYLDGRRCVVGFNAKTSTGAHRLLVSGACTGSSRAIDVILPPKGSTSTPLVRGPGGTITVRGVRQAPVGAAVCASGPTTGWRCGTIQAKNVTITFPGGTLYGLTRTSICSEPGDHGRPVMAGDQAQGITVGGSGNCTSGGTTYFMPLPPTLSAYDLTLHTA